MSKTVKITIAVIVVIVAVVVGFLIFREKPTPAEEAQTKMAAEWAENNPNKINVFA